MTKHKTPESDNQSYAAVGIVFFAVGFGMLFTGETRAVGIPFLVLGITFFAISRQKPSSDDKK